MIIRSRVRLVIHSDDEDENEVESQIGPNSQHETDCTQQNNQAEPRIKKSNNKLNVSFLL
jgi:hypothetical protein